MDIEITEFGIVGNQNVQLFSMTNDHGVVVKITNYGAIVTAIDAPDKNGVFKNVVLGFDTLEDYLSDDYLSSYPYFGSVIGRVGNRIANGAFELDGVQYQLSKNGPTYQLHGGTVGFDRKIWMAKPFQHADEIGLTLTYLSVDGEEGYPGNLNVMLTYTLNNKNEFSIDYAAVTDKATPVNMTQHTYFNLGDDSTIKNHHLQLNSSEIMETSGDTIPTGKMLSVANTPFDFRVSKQIGQDFDQLEMGYDHTYSLHNETGDLIKIAELVEPVSGRKIEVQTTEISMQLYTGAWNPSLNINGKLKFGKYSGIALETQHFPDAVNQKEFPSTILRPGEKYHEKTIYKFSVEVSF